MKWDMEEKEEILRPNDGYGRFAVKTLLVSVLLVGVAELCGVRLYQGTDHGTLLRVTAIVTSIGGMSAFMLFALGTYVHVLTCITLRRINKERKRSKDHSITNNSQTIQNQERDED